MFCAIRGYCRESRKKGRINVTYFKRTFKDVFPCVQTRQVRKFTYESLQRHFMKAGVPRSELFQYGSCTHVEWFSLSLRQLTPLRVTVSTLSEGLFLGRSETRRFSFGADFLRARLRSSRGRPLLVPDAGLFGPTRGGSLGGGGRQYGDRVGPRGARLNREW